MAKQGMNTVKFALKNFWTDYVGYGRANRAEFWWVFLFYSLLVPFVISFVFNFIAAFCAASIGSNYNSCTQIFFGLDMLISMGWSSVLLVGAFCLSVRRLHDTNRSAWNLLWGLLPIVGAIILLVYFIMPGDKGANRFGKPRN